MCFAVLRHMCVTASRDDAARFLGEVRHQIRLSQALRHREQSMQGGMMVEKPWPGEPTIEEMARHMLVGSPEVIAERFCAGVAAVHPCHYLLQFQAGASYLGTALRSIDRFAGEVRPLLEKALGPLDRVGVAQPAPASD